MYRFKLPMSRSASLSDPDIRQEVGNSNACFPSISRLFLRWRDSL